MSKILLVVIVSCCLTVPFARAETIDLPKALAMAVAHRPLAEAARQNAEAARQQASAAKSHYFPQVAVAENFAVTNEPGSSMFMTLNQEQLNLRDPALDLNHPDTTKDFETRLSLQQPLFNPDISYGYQQARQGAVAAAATARRSEEQIAFGAFNAYLTVQQAHAVQAWAESYRKNAGEVLRVASQRREAGVGLKADELRARVFLAEAERRLVTARNDLEIARRRLALALGEPEAVVDIARDLTPELFVGREQTPALQRGDLEALSARAKAAELAYRQSRAAYLPRLGLQASYALHDSSTPFGSEGDGWSVGAGLSWELFDGGRRAADKGRAAAMKRALEAQRLDATREARLQVEVARRRAEEARFNLKTAREAVSQAEEGNRLTQDRYQAGLANLSDLLGTQSALDQARMDAVRAESALLMALGNVLFQNGTFLKTFLPDEVNP